VIDLLELDGEQRVQLAEDERRRLTVRSGPARETVVDRLGAFELRSLRLRPAAGGEGLRVALGAGPWRPLAPGWGRVAHVAPRTIWQPREPRRVDAGDAAGRLHVYPPAPSLPAGPAWELPPLPADSFWSLPLLVVHDPERRVERELEALAARSWPSLRKSDWFRADSPADLWDALVDGAVFDPRPCTGSPRRFRCQQCALAWWSYLWTVGADDSALCRMLASAVAWTVRAQLEEPGGWRHGLWRDPPETHLRFYVDGVNLLLGEAGRSGQAAWRDAAERALRGALERFHDELADGSLWFLHDSLEADGEPTAAAPPALGQAAGNTLCLNTHLQALAALRRLDAPWAGEAYARGLRALRRLLELRSAPRLYRLLDAWLPAVFESRGRPGLRARALRGLFLRLLSGPYWWLRRRHPRLVHPGGFIERDMASTMLADPYHVLNLKDLLVLYALDPQPWLEPGIRAGVGFLRRLDLRRGLDRSLMFVEAVEVLRQYGRLFEAGATAEADRAAATVRAVTGGASLDDAFWNGGGPGLAAGRPVSAPA
jgi:hypothetical protein